MAFEPYVPVQPHERASRGLLFLAAVGLVGLILITTTAARHGGIRVEIGGHGLDVPNGPIRLDPGPGRELVYRDRTGYGDDVAAMVERWNSVGARVRLVPAAPGQRAKITLRTVTPPEDVRWAGLARTRCRAVIPCRRPDTAEILLNGASVRSGRSWRRHVIAHEFGHALGLEHDPKGCSVMAADHRGRGTCRDPARTCGPQMADAIALVGIWGGQVRPTFTDAHCTEE